jgi:hypothetical protein
MGALLRATKRSLPAQATEVSDYGKKQKTFGSHPAEHAHRTFGGLRADGSHAQCYAQADAGLGVFRCHTRAQARPPHGKIRTFQGDFRASAQGNPRNRCMKQQAPTVDGLLWRFAAGGVAAQNAVDKIIRAHLQKTKRRKAHKKLPPREELSPSRRHNNTKDRTPMKRSNPTSQPCGLPRVGKGSNVTRHLTRKEHENRNTKSKKKQASVVE